MLLCSIKRHIRARRTPPARFSRDAVGDPWFTFDLHDEREPRAQTVARVNAYIDRLEQETSAC